MKDWVTMFYKKCIILSGVISIVFGLVILDGDKSVNCPSWLTPVCIGCGTVVIVGGTFSEMLLLFKKVQGVGEKGLVGRIRDIERGKE